MKHAVYPGSFDPFTNGHLDIVRRAGVLFDRITIAVLQNTSKKTLLPVEERVRLIQQIMQKEAAADMSGKVDVEPFAGLLVDFCRKKDIRIIIRGLRTVTDYDYEQAIAMMNRSLLPGLETIFLTADKEHSFTSSTIVKEVASFGGDISEQVPEVVSQKLEQLYRSRQ